MRLASIPLATSAFLTASARFSERASFARVLPVLSAKPSRWITASGLLLR